MDDPLCVNCGHPRSNHTEEQPYLCLDIVDWGDSEWGQMCPCEGFSYINLKEEDSCSPSR